MTAGAIVVAAGRSERMGGGDKILQSLAGRPVIAHSLAAFAGHPSVDALVVVASESNIETLSALAAAIAPEARVVLGGPRRRDSVLNGLDALPPVDHVIVHDGARPLVTPQLIDVALAAAAEMGAAVCGVPVSDTVKRAHSTGLVRGTVTRDGLWLAQTPQAFRTGVLRRAHASSDIDVTDDCALVELLHEPVRLVPGSPQNIKITTPADLALAEALIAARGA